MRLPAGFGLTVLLCGVASAQTIPDAAEILKKVSGAYKGVTQYEVVMDRVEKDPSTGESAGAHIVTVVKTPDRYRIERTSVGNSKSVNIVVLDGTAIWFYDSEANQYASFPAASIGKDLPEELEAGGVDYFTVGRFRSAEEGAAKAKFLREESVEIGGARISCFVVSGTDGTDDYTWWIDKKTSHVVRENDNTSMTIFTTVKLGEMLPSNTFKFEPPAGSTKSGSGPR